MYSDRDMIVARATPEKIRAPLAIIRISGEGCWKLVSRRFRPMGKGDPAPWRMVYGDWVDEKGVIDDVTLVRYRAPRSYSGQDMVEVYCHGNPLLVDAIIRGMLELGARRARPGEFTMRALLNGKMDLLQAEAVQGVIEANTRYQVDLVRRQAKGPLLGFTRQRVEEILQIQAHIEATIDYGEEDVAALARETLLARMRVLLGRFESLHRTASFANTMRRGFRILITGAPNVGKSTLFNALVRQERAIVTSLPGTTRDLISEEIEIEGLPVVLIDSAGVRETGDTIEKMGIEKIYSMLEEVDLVLYLKTASREEAPYPKLPGTRGEKWLTVYTKLDLNEGTPLENNELWVSAQTGEGLGRLEKQIVLQLASAMEGQSVYLINQRQEEVIAGVIENLKNALDDYRDGFGEEVLSSYLNTARRLLGELTGETTVEDILDRMFSNFCLGK